MKKLFSFLLVISIVLISSVNILVGCSSNKPADDQHFASIEECVVVKDSLINVVDTLQYKLDSIQSADLKLIESEQELIKELELLTKTMDSIKQSNTNLRKYIDHQGSMIKPNKK